MVIVCLLVSILSCILLYNFGIILVSYLLMRLSVNYSTDIPVSFDDIRCMLDIGFVNSSNTLVFWKNNERLYVKGHKIIYVGNNKSECYYLKNLKEYIKFVLFIKGHRK